MLFRKVVSCSVLLKRTLPPPIFSVLSIAAADWKAQTLRWAGGESSCWNPGFSRTTILACPLPPVPSNVETGAEATSSRKLTGLRKGLTHPILPYSLRATGFKKKQNKNHNQNPQRTMNKTKQRSSPHQAKPVPEHSCTGWVTSLCAPDSDWQWFVKALVRSGMGAWNSRFWEPWVLNARCSGRVVSGLQEPFPWGSSREMKDTWPPAGK